MAGRGKSRFSDPFSDRQRAFDKRYARDILDARKSDASLLDDLAGLHPQIGELEVAHAIVGRPLGWG
jgi:hypothetical protein